MEFIRCQACGTIFNRDIGYCPECKKKLKLSSGEGRNESSLVNVKYQKLSVPELKTRYYTQEQGKETRDEQERPIQREENKRRENIFTLFTREDWKEQWTLESAKFGFQNMGLIVTANLVGAPTEEYGEFLSALHSYVLSREEEGVYYYVVDLQEQKVSLSACGGKSSSVLEMLKKIYAVGKAKYLFLVGGADEFVIENHADDEDVDVLSDLPYSMLSEDSPWTRGNWYNYPFEECIRVGRMLLGQNFSLAKTYFRNVVAKKNKPHDMESTFSLSARSFQSPSRMIVDECLNPEIELLISPSVISADFLREDFRNHCYHPNGKAESFLLFFNLHGSSNTSSWYGEDRGSYPEAYRKDCLPSGENGYVIVTEACYGARKKSKNDLLPVALQNGCFNFVGSSRIAYGSIGKSLSCADVIAKCFLEAIKEGYDAGDALIQSFRGVAKSSRQLTDQDIKTIIEFSLYGDPSLRFADKKKSAKKETDDSFRFHSSERMFNPYKKRFVSYRSVPIEKSFKELLEKYLRKEIFKLFEGVQPKFYHSETEDDYQAVYSKKCENFNVICNVFFDKDGKVKNCLISK